MPAIQCRKCNSTTNTAVCDWINSPDDMADECYARFVDGKWERGCAEKIPADVAAFLVAEIASTNHHTPQK